MDRLPNGYAKLVKNTKEKFRAEVEKIQHMVIGKNAKEATSIICKNYSCSNYYLDPKNNCVHYDIDVECSDGAAVSAFLELNIKTMKCKMGNTVCVWTHLTDKSGETYWVDAYKW